MQVREEDADKEVNQRPATDGGVFLLPPGNNATLLINTVYYPDATGSEPYITTFSYDLKDAVYNKDENGAYLSSGFMGGREYNISAIYTVRRYKAECTGCLVGKRWRYRDRRRIKLKQTEIYIFSFIN